MRRSISLVVNKMKSQGFRSYVIDDLRVEKENTVFVMTQILMAENIIVKFSVFIFQIMGCCTK